jgi:hypothetical protein
MMSELSELAANLSSCSACGQRIPATAKLAARTITQSQAQTLGIGTKVENFEDVPVKLCLNCRIRLAELSR